MSREVLPPHDPGVEQSVISAAILSPDALDECLPLLEPEHFYVAAHREIWRAIRDVNAERQPVDVRTVAHRLRQLEALDRVGGTPYLAEIVDATPAVAHVATHARIVRDKARLREVVDLCRRYTAEAYGDVQDVTRFVGDIEARLSDVARLQTEETQRTFRELAQSASKDYYQRKRDGTQFVGIPTGLRSLDRGLRGLKRGQKYLVAGRPGTGKSGFGLTVARNVAHAGWGVVFISVEQPGEQQIQRAIAQEVRLDTGDIDCGGLSSEDEVRFQTAVRAVSQLPIVVDDAPEQTVTSIRSAVRRGLRRLKAEFERVELGLVVIDYLQLLEPRKDGNRNRSRENEVSELSRGTRFLARELKVPLLELAQLSREVEKRPDKRPILSDLRDSGSLEQDAFGVMMLYRADSYRKPDETPDNTAEVLIRKLRQGGKTGRVTLRFHAPSTGFYDLEAGDYDDLGDDWHDNY